MRSRPGLFMVAVLAFSISIVPALAADLYVATSGNNPSNNCQSSANPCATIQYAVDVAAGTMQPDVIHVASGTYNECVNAFGVQVDLVADTAGDAVVLDGDGVCGGTACTANADLACDLLEEGACTGTCVDGTCDLDSSVTCTTDAECDFGFCDFKEPSQGSFGPALILGDGSSVTGFVIRNGGDGGVILAGSGEITNNTIEGNFSGSFGGGIYVYAAYLGYGTDGAVDALRCWGDTGVACSVDADCTAAEVDGPCLLTRVVTIEGNTVRDNIADFGAGLEAFLAPIYGSAAEVAITNNTFDGNTASNVGGGADVTVYYGGFKRLAAEGNTFTDNNAEVGGGLAWTSYFSYDQTEFVVTQNEFDGNEGFLLGGGSFSSSYTLGEEVHDVSANSFTGNFSYYGGGAWVSAYSSFSGTDLTVGVAENLFDGNEAFSGAGLFTLLETDYTFAGPSSFTVEGNDIRSNDAFVGAGIAAYWFGDTISLNASLDLRGNSIVNNSAYYAAGGAFLAAVGSNSFSEPMSFRNNVVSRNRASDPFAFGGGVVVFGDSQNLASTAVDLDLNTFFQNESSFGGSDLEVVSETATLGSMDVNVTNTMFADIFGIAVGGDEPGGDQNLLITLNYDLFHGVGQPWERSIEPWLNIVSPDNHVFADPLLDAALIPDVCSPAVDAGDPLAAFDLEPEPNGDRVNLGSLGNTPDAQQTLPDTGGDGAVDGRDLLSISAAFGSAAGGVRYSLDVDLDGNGLVDGDDLAYVASFYGIACP